MQASMNAAFSKSTGSPAFTGLALFIIGLVTMVLYMLLSRTHVPDMGTIKSAPGFSFLGGVVVAIYVVMITIITPKLGVGSAIGLIVTGQIISAICIDHFGLFNAAIRTVSMTRIAGMLLMILGIYLVMRKAGA
jgi:transporter family-2 protein